MIKNIVFDIGQVLVEFNWRKHLEEWFDDEETRKHVAEATVLNRLWMEIDRGAKTLEELIEECVQYDTEYEEAIRYFFSKKNTIAREFPYAVEWIRELQGRGYKVYLLSNYSEHAFEYLLERSRFYGIVDGAIISYRIKTVKPEREIYEALFSTYGLNPEECVFLDDLQKNLDGAAVFGMKTILFTGYEEGKKKLEELLCAEGQENR